MSTAWWALGVSTLSLAVASASLVWNIKSFRKSGPNVSVALMPGCENADFNEVSIDETRFVRVRFAKNQGELRISRAQFKLRMANNGRTAISVIHAMMSMTTSDGQASVQGSWRSPGPLPLRLEAGAAAEFHIHAQELVIPNNTDTFQAVATLSDGSRIVTPPIDAASVEGLVDAMQWM